MAYFGDITTSEPNNFPKNDKKTIINGIVKWFRPGGGFGFILPDGGGPDVLLHESALSRGEFKMVFKGAKITCEVSMGKKGMYAVTVLDLEQISELNRPAPQGRGYLYVTAEGGWCLGVIKWFNTKIGIGYAVIDRRNDVMIHIETLRRCAIISLKPKQLIWIRYGQGPKGLLATDIRLK